MGRQRDRLTALQVKTATDGWYNDGGKPAPADRRRRSQQEVGAALRPPRQGGRDWPRRRGSSDAQAGAQAPRQAHGGLGGGSRSEGGEARRWRRRAANRRPSPKRRSELIATRRKGQWRVSANDGRTSSLDEWTKHLKVDCKPIADRYVGEIGVDDIKPVVPRPWRDGRANTARRLLKRIETVFECAKAHGWRKADNPATWSIFQHIFQASAPTGPKPHHPALNWRETPAFIARLRSMGEPSMAALALEMIVLTVMPVGRSARHEVERDRLRDRRLARPGRADEAQDRERSPAVGRRDGDHQAT